MSETPISVTLAARNFSDCINRVRYHGTSFLLEKNGVPVARIVPAQPISSPDFDRLAESLPEAQEALSERIKPEEGPGEVVGDSNRNQEQVPHPKRSALNW